MANLFALSESDVVKLRAMVQWFETFNGPGITNGPGGATSGGQPGPTDTSSAVRVLWIARVGASTQDSPNYRWTYVLTEIYKSSAGYDGWTDTTDGFTSTAAYSFAEDQNGSSGLMGNGVDDDNLVGTFAAQPIPVGTRVLVSSVILADGTAEDWIVGMPNGIDGACP